ncbi:MAG: nitroreductase family protein [Cellvibrionaceae bacterium]
MTFDEILHKRRSVRGFLPGEEVPAEILRDVFLAAQRAPSNCNVQPWQVFVVSGHKRKKLAKALVAEARSKSPKNPDFGEMPSFTGEYRKRQVACAFALYDALDIERDDREERFENMLRNFEFFDAPHVAFICMPKEYETVNAIDVGAYLQTLMLAMADRGLACCAQLALSYYPDVVHQFLPIPQDMGVLVGLSFGYEDQEHPANDTRTSRASVEDAVRFFE